MANSSRMTADLARFSRAASLLSSRGLAWVATLAVALLFMGGALLRPENNFDAITYAALAKQFRGEAGHAAAYEEMRVAAGPEAFGRLVGGPYGARMASDEAYFQANLPFYASKPLYIAAVSLLGRLTGSDLLAMSLVSAAATAIAIVLSFFLGTRLLPPQALVAVPLAWFVAAGLKTATLRTPDALAIMFQIAFVLAWLNDRSDWRRTLVLTLLAVAWVATRSNAILLLAFLLAAEWLYAGGRRRLLPALLVAAAAVATYLLVGRLSGNLGHVVLFNFAFVDQPDAMKFPNFAISVVGYAKAVIYGLFEAATNHPEFLLTIVVLACLGAADLGRPKAASALEARIRALAPAMLVTMIVHFLLYPAAWERLFVGFYVVTVLLVARWAATVSGRAP